MTGGPHPSARVAGGPARQRRACGERPDGPRGEEREGEGDGPSWPKREREGKGYIFCTHRYKYFKWKNSHR
uniref:Pr1-like protein n=1 Tax=Oryza sativa subsp. japonica TaxID=39947 RepID=Q5Z445_ORYSJ|nr:pr1-like protein [Oryza sativa Japonica Group]